MFTRLVWSLALTGLASTGCSAARTYECRSNAQCVDDTGASGICEPGAVCSFADTSCATTQRRYADGGGPLVGMCVAAPRTACVSDLAGGLDHFCIVRSDATVWCWGANAAGQLGDGTTLDRASPVAARTPPGRTFHEVRVSENHTCALATDDTLWCWGGNDVGQLGVITAAGVAHADSPLPIQVMAVSGAAAPYTLSPFKAKHIAAGGKHTCAIDPAGALWCWGENADGQCGFSPTAVDDALYPMALPGLASGIIAVDVGDEHSVSLRDDGSVFEFGGNANGQLGDGTTTDSYLPVKAKITSVAALTGGDEHSCALKSDGSIWCWGYGAAVGLAGGQDQATPQRLLTGKSIWAGGSAFHTCAVQDNALLCWGANDVGQIGMGSIEPGNTTVTLPTRALIATVARAAASENDTCAVTAEGQLWCWGANNHGQLGQGTIGEPSAVPLRVAVTCD